MQARAGTRYEVVLSVTAILAIAVAISASPIGAAQTFSVTTTTDTVDADLDDPACLDAAGECSLRAAVMQANKTPGADTITLSAETYTLTLPSPDPAGPNASVGDLDITDDLTITGAGRDLTIISGGTGWSDRLLEVSFEESSTSSERDLSLAVSGVRLTGGRSNAIGGAINFSAVEAHLAFRDVLVSENTIGPGVSLNGGGAYVRAKELTLEDVVFSDNTATGTGGGLHIHAPDDASVTVATNLELSRNTSVQGGGGLQTQDLGSKLDVTGLVVEDNTTGTSSTNGAGGGLYLGADAVLRDVQIGGNTANAGGGGINAQAEITIDGGVIEGNAAIATGTGFPAQGGGIKFHSAPGKKIELTDLVIDGNSAADGGGASISSSQQSDILPGSRVVLERVAVTNNFVISPGVNNNSTGGLSIQLVTNSPSAALVNVTIGGNRGGEYGIGNVSPSGIRLFGSPTEKPLLRNVTIAHNGPGAALSNNSFGSSVRVENTVVGANQGGNCPAGSTWVASLGGNLEQGTGSGTCNFGLAGVVADAKLGQLTGDRGTTVVPLLADSPALDKVVTNCPAVDQRGVDRPDGNAGSAGACDIGAYELVPVPPSANLSLTKSDSPDPVQVGQELTYTIVVANAGPDPAVGVSVTDNLPTTVSLVSATASPGGPCPGTTTVTCQLGTIASNGSATVTIKVTPSTDADLSNTATVSSPTADPDTGNNTAVQTTIVDPAPPASADLSVTKSSAPDPVRVGQELTYTITVSNGGPSPATGAVLTDALPGNVTFGSAAASQGSCSGTTTVTCSLGTVASGASATIVVKVTPTTDVDLSNTATATSSTADPNLLNNSATEATVVSPPSADLVLTKTAPAAVAVGGPITYALTVRNAGPDAASSFTVTDTLPAGVTNPRSLSSGCTAAPGTITCGGGNLAVGQSASLSFTVTAPATAGPVTNTARITASTPADAVPANDTASATTQVQPPGVDLSLTHSAPTLVVLGGTYVLRATVTNNGPGIATNVRVTEQLRYAGDKDGLRYVSGSGRCATSGSASTVVCSAASLAPGSSVTFDLTLKPYLECTLLGTLADDTLTGTPARDIICGGAGNDTIAGGAGRDVLLGMGPSGRGVRAVGSVGADQTENVPGNETANTQTTVGGPAYANDRDTINGQDGSDEIDGGYGGDTLRGGADDDTIQGGPGTDTIWGEGGGDLLEGGPGLDTIYGGIGGDELHGGPGQRDPETGEWSPDVAPNSLDGGPGQDFCSKGKPPDTRENCEKPK